MQKKLFIAFGLILCGGVIMGLFSFMFTDKAKYRAGDTIKTVQLAADNDSQVTLPLKNWTVLYFYPKDNTPGCTTQAKGFTSLMKEYEKAKIKVFGISTDTVESHLKFKKKHSIKITLLSDPKGSVAKDFGVKVMLGMCSRDAVILDPSGKVNKIHRGVSPKASPADILEYITDLQDNQ